MRALDVVGGANCPWGELSLTPLFRHHYFLTPLFHYFVKLTSIELKNGALGGVKTVLSRT